MRPVPKRVAYLRVITRLPNLITSSAATYYDYEV